MQDMYEHWEEGGQDLGWQEDQGGIYYDQDEKADWAVGDYIYGGHPGYEGSTVPQYVSTSLSPL
jgi:hypothetical protein